MSHYVCLFSLFVLAADFGRHNPVLSPGLAEAYDGSSSLIGGCIVDETLVGHMGVMAGAFAGEGGCLAHVTEICEKPSVEYARSNLGTAGLDPGQYLSVFGLYVLAPALFSLLEEAVASNMRTNGSFALTPCLEQLRKEQGLQSLVINGTRFDIGLNPASYADALANFGTESAKPSSSPVNF